MTTHQPETLPEVKMLPTPEVEDLPDLGAELPCEGFYEQGAPAQCPRPAAWSMRLDICGHVALLCSTHRAEVAIRESSGRYYLICDVCDIAGQKSSSWRRL